MNLPRLMGEILNSLQHCWSQCFLNLAVIVMLQDTIRKTAQDNVGSSLRHCFEWLQHCSNIVTLCCAKTRRCESLRVTSPEQKFNTFCSEEKNDKVKLLFSKSNVFSKNLFPADRIRFSWRSEMLSCIGFHVDSRKGNIIYIARRK